jgi:hypothetical protein
MKVIWLQDIYDRAGDIVVEYRKSRTSWPDSWPSGPKNKEFFIFIPIVLILVYMHGYYQIE